MDFIIKLVRYTNPIMVDSESLVTISLEAISTTESVDVHFGFHKGGECLIERVERIDLKQTLASHENKIDVSTTLSIPFQVEEPDSQHARFYYYVYVTPSGGTWTSESPGVMSGPVDFEAKKMELDVEIAGNKLLLHSVDVGRKLDNMICDMAIARNGQIMLTAGKMSLNTDLKSIDPNVLRVAIAYLDKNDDKRDFKSAIKRMKKATLNYS